jgi:hypothetical protein
MHTKEQSFRNTHPSPRLPMSAGETILRVYFQGYRDGFPSSVVARLFHEHGKLAEPEVTNEPLQPMHFVDSPMPRICHIVLEDKEKPTLAAYRQPDIEMTACTLELAIKRSHAVILAHADPEAIALDPLCQRVGGHIHIATITPSKGFKWVIAPIGNRAMISP